MRAHKAAWEKVITIEQKPLTKKASEAKRQHFMRLFEFEVMKVKNEILASSASLAKQRLEYLTQFLMDEFMMGIPYRKILFEAFADLAILGGGEQRISLPLLRAISDMHNHLAGPEYVSIEARDKWALNASLEIIENIGSFGVYLIPSAMVVRRTCQVLVERPVITSFYAFREFSSKVKRVLKSIRKECEIMSMKERKTYHITEKIRLIESAIGSI